MQAFFHSFGSTFLSASPYMLLGLIISGLLHVYLPEEKIKKWFAGDGLWPILKAALLGVPLPLCSCSVIPAAISLRKAGASKGATSAFLISTPESGVDSIAITYGLMGISMAMIRPVGALLSGVLAGVFQKLFNSERTTFEKVEGPYHSHDHQDDCCQHGEIKNENSFVGKVKKAMRYAFVDLVEDMAWWFFLGLILSAIISVLVPFDVMTKFNGPLGKLSIILLSIPLYICASAATPVAAAMMSKGLSPGSAILFLFLGPATNISNLLVLQKFLGKKAILLNLAAIFLVSMMIAIAVDYFSIPIVRLAPTSSHENYSSGDYFFSGIFGLFLVRGLSVVSFNFIKGSKK